MARMTFGAADNVDLSLLQLTKSGVHFGSYNMIVFPVFIRPLSLFPSYHHSTHGRLGMLKKATREPTAT